MQQRMDISYRVITDVNDTLVVNYDSTVDTTCTIAAGLYMSAHDLASALQNAIDAQLSSVASFEVDDNSDGTVSINSTDQAFTLTWNSSSLRDWLGFSSDLSGSASYTGDVQPGVLINTLPWVNDLHGWVWSIKGTKHHNQQQAVKINRRDLWSLQVFETTSNIDHLRGFLTHLLKGTPATWYRDITNSAPWTYTNWFGRIEACIDPRSTSYVEAFENPNNLQHTFSVQLDMVAL